MSNSFAGLTLYCTLSGLEEDLRELISIHLLRQKEPSQILGNDLWATCIDRLKKDVGYAYDETTLEHVIIYLDFADSYQVLNANASLLPQEVARYIKKITPSLEKLIPIRNRVAHSRPLNFEDFPLVMDTAQQLIREQESVWKNLKANLSRLKNDPSYVVGINIPTYQSNSIDQKHNLPTPDFDDTGFLGRQKQVEELVGLCLGAYPVITVVGEGGIGKTSLAQKVAYDILDLPNCPYEAIVWTTSKTTQITAREIINIEGAISNSLGMIQDVAARLGPKEIEDPFEEVLKYLEAFPILLILDNLETVLDDRIRAFLRRIPKNSKILITSRIGLGDAEFRVKLEPMDDNETVQLLRALAKVRGVPDLVKMEKRRLLNYCKKMSNNPGFVKWFVAAVQAGSRPEDILDKPNMFYEFCMTNIYGYLNRTSRAVLRSMLFMPGRYSQAKLAFLNEMDASDLQVALHELWRTNMVSMTSMPRSATFETQYELTDLARGYLLKYHPLKKDEAQRLEVLRRQLNVSAEEMRATQTISPYSTFSIAARTSDDLILVRYLKDALNHAGENQIELAQRSVDKARRLAPEYFEVHRVAAFVYEKQGNIPAARQEYEAAIELEPTSAPLHVLYGMFLLEFLDDPASALEQFQEAGKIDPGALEVQLHVARVSLALRHFDEARETINQLQARLNSETTSEWVRRKIYDVHLQYFQRKADHLCSIKDRSGAVRCLTELKKAYQECSPYLMDLRMEETISKAANTASDCANLIQDKSTKTRIHKLSKWFSARARKSVSPNRKLIQAGLVSS